MQRFYYTRAWQNEQRLDLHGWVYGLKDGVIKPVFEMKAGTAIDPLYVYDNLQMDVLSFVAPDCYRDVSPFCNSFGQAWPFILKAAEGDS